MVAIDLVEKVAFRLYSTLIFWHAGGGVGWAWALCVASVPHIGPLSSSSMSRRFKRASGKRLAELAERDLSSYDIVGLCLNGKTFLAMRNRRFEGRDAAYEPGRRMRAPL